MGHGKRGAPKAKINWKDVDILIMSGCSGAEVAAHYGLNKATIYDRCFKDHGIPYAEYSKQKRSKGNALIKAHRYAKALGKTDKGDNTLLIWLSKVRLKEIEPRHEEDSEARSVNINITSYSEKEVEVDEE